MEKTCPERFYLPIFQRILDRTISSGSFETREHFFASPRLASNPIEGSQQQSDLSTACHSRSELIPRLARAKNLRGKWKYLVQEEGNNVQHFQVSTLRIV